MAKVGAARRSAVIFCRAASIHAPGPVIPDFVVDARYRFPRFAIVEKRGRICHAIKGEMRGAHTTTASSLLRRMVRQCYLPGLKDVSSAAISAGGSSTAISTHVKSLVIRKMMSPLTVLSRLMWLLAVLVARHLYRTSAGSRGHHARILYHIATDLATSFFPAVITAQISAILVPVAHAFKLST